MDVVHYWVNNNTLLGVNWCSTLLCPGSHAPIPPWCILLVCSATVAPEALPGVWAGLLLVVITTCWVVIALPSTFQCQVVNLVVRSTLEWNLTTQEYWADNPCEPTCTGGGGMRGCPCQALENLPSLQLSSDAAHLEYWVVIGCYNHMPSYITFQCQFGCQE